MSTFRLGLTRDFLTSAGEVGWGDIGLAALRAYPEIDWEFLPTNEAELSPTVAQEFDALIVLSPRVTEHTVKDSQRLKLIARFGVGYDSVDLDACNAAGIVVTIAPDGVRRPMAMAAITLLLALSHNLLIKDGLVRDGLWGERLHHMGIGVTGRALGLIGLGNIGREIVSLALPLGLSCMAFDPYVAEQAPIAAGVELVQLDELLARSDYVCVSCPLNEATYHLIGEQELARMKPSAFLINVARGPIVEQDALVSALRSGGIRGAGLDVFEREPAGPANPLSQCPNVILAPHSLGWTDELAIGIGMSNLHNVIAVSKRRLPEHIVNPAALEHPRLAGWFER
ncbi:MAG TPA: NAD(P)-dependent oxidoreductase [Acidimicrobiales bacterium]|nr:NAD(P)-dependent oxidoreductase [Acidimicrobiales bacterium]